MSVRLTAAQRRAIQARRTAMKATARRENPGLASALWRGAKSGYHGYRAARYETKAARHRAWAKNPRIVGTIPGTASEIRYLRSGANPGQYRHPFEHPVRMYAMNDGSVLLRGRMKIHADDREKHFDQYVHRHHRRRNPMARGDNTMLYVGLGVLAYMMLKPGGLFGSTTQDLHNMPAGTVWVDTTDGTMVVGPSIPGPNWRLATQTEIQNMVGNAEGAFQSA